MRLIPDTITSSLARLGTAAQNALEVARFGGLDTKERPAPYEVAVERRGYRLRHYFPNTTNASRRPAVVLVPPMMLAADVYDVSPASSAVSVLHDGGVDPWVVDFGSPDREEGGLDRTLADHVVAVSDAVDRVKELSGSEVHLGGYSQGGMFCYQAAAYRRSEGIASIVVFGSPVDAHGAMPLGIPEEVATRLASVLAERIFAGRRPLPAWASRTGFRLLDPVKSVRQRLDFLLALHDREALLAREGQRRFLMQEGWVAWSAPAVAELLQQFVVHNRMLSGGFVIEGRLVTLADLSCPVLCFVGEVDQIAPPRPVRAIARAAPEASPMRYRCRPDTSALWSARRRPRSRGPRWLRGRAGMRV